MWSRDAAVNVPIARLRQDCYGCYATTGMFEKLKLLNGMFEKRRYYMYRKERLSVNQNAVADR